MATRSRIPIEPETLGIAVAVGATVVLDIDLHFVARSDGHPGPRGARVP